MNPSAANVTDHAPGSRSMPLAGPTSVTFAAAAALVAAVSAGCSSGHAAAERRAPAAPASGVQTVAIGTTEGFRFTPATATVRTGQVRITLTDEGSYPHNISFPGFGRTSSSVSGSPGQSSTSLLVTIGTPGRYGFVCTYHSSAGMKGDLVVLKRP